MKFTLPGAKVEHAHGTNARYVLGCRCAECRAANTAAYHRSMDRAREAAREIVSPGPGGLCPGVNGAPCPTRVRLRTNSTSVCHGCRRRLVWNGLVDAEPARRHIRKLSRQGVGTKSIEAASGVPNSTLWKILNRERRKLRKSTADRILSVDIGAAGDHSRIPAGPTWKMLRILEAEYLTKTALALALGYKGPGLQIGRRRVLAKTELRVRKLYRKALGDGVAE